jgi:hypothetical protein
MTNKRTIPPTLVVASSTPAKVPSWRETVTLVRMMLAFLFPSPFLTRRLQGKIDRREQRLAAQQSAFDASVEPRRG